MNDISTQPAPGIWSHMVTVSSQQTLAELTEQSPVLLVFLRFFGCSFCREAISDISKRRKNLEAKGFRIVLVHMAPDAEVAEKFFKKYRLHPIEHISDPEKKFYRAFGLSRGTSQQLFGLMNWIRGFQASVIDGHGASFHGEDLGDGFQMPGVFTLHRGQVIRSFVHQHPYDRPDYEAICTL
ncbi:MAG TPA: peroxiredoxin-like family protein [Saprospiraceae bacterium]|nr:peroxiredoxin-like family protein [Saprospiraceae bacterium]HND88566.1 peroxiredoxin-like family protein [Saprospiraceae bacterium]